MSFRWQQQASSEDEDEPPFGSPSAVGRRAGKQPARAQSEDIRFSKRSKSDHTLDCIKNVCNYYEAQLAASAAKKDSLRNEFEELLRTIVADGYPASSEEWFAATMLLRDNGNREIFKVIDSPQLQGEWLRRAWAFVQSK